MTPCDVARGHPPARPDHEDRLASRADTVMLAWNAAVTAAWAGPLLAFTALHHASPPPMPLPVICAILAASGIAALRIPDTWLRGSAPARRESMHGALGVRSFGAIVPGGRIMNRMVRRGEASPWQGTHGALARIERRSRDAERTHWWWLLTSAAIILWALGIGARRSAVLLAVLNIPLNVYPILLQRHTRDRVARIVHARSHEPEAVRAGPRHEG